MTFGVSQSLKPTEEKFMGARSYFLLNDEITSTDEVFVDKSQEVSGNADLLKGVKILVIDDNPINLSVAEKTLSKFGAVSYKSYSAKDGIKQFVSNQVDIVLMDLHMPLIDGFEATKLIKQTKEFQNNPIPILAYTTYSYSEVKEAIKKYGLDGYIGKPFTQAHVVETIIASIQKKK